MSDVIDRLRGLYGAAPPAPWGCDGPTSWGYRIYGADDHLRNHSTAESVDVADLIVAMHEALPALLDVVAAVAEIDPTDSGDLHCRFCGAHIPYTDSCHDRDCPWLAARRLCGMEAV